MTDDSTDLTGHFLIAMPAMDSPVFAKTVTLICEHTKEGALGLVINRPIDMTVGSLFESLDMTITEETISQRPVFVGGPVQTERGFVLHRPMGRWQSTLSVVEGVGLTSSRDILSAFTSGEMPDQWMIALGYAGWAAGQLEDELAQNAWLTAPADLSIVFDLPVEARFSAAMALLGASVASLSGTAGHA